jgi:hypothetical protein
MPSHPHPIPQHAAALSNQILLHCQSLYFPPYWLLTLALLVFKRTSASGGAPACDATRTHAFTPPLHTHTHTQTRTEWNFTYPASTLGLEVSALFVFAGLEWSRAVIGAWGNRVGDRSRLAEYLLLSLMSGVALLYFLLWQTFV